MAYDIAIEDIIIGDRKRHDMGDIDALAKSIEGIGLLQPIGVNKQNQLVFGHRRLLACKQLGWDAIPCSILDIGSIVAGEYAENEIRKAFTVSERVEIARAVEEEEKPKAQERKVDAGRSAGKVAGRGRPKADRVTEKSPEPKQKRRESRDVAAKKSGLGSDHTYRNAAKVVDKGTDKLREAMDSELLSIFAASKIADLPKSEQNAAIKVALEKKGTHPKKDKTTGETAAWKTRTVKRRVAENIVKDANRVVELLGKHQMKISIADVRSSAKALLSRIEEAFPGVTNV